MSITNLGKRDHQILRDSSVTGLGEWIDGEWIPASKISMKIRANIQPSTFSYRTQLLSSGDRNKEAIAIYSNDWLYTANKGEQPLECDIVLYRGAQWEVVVSKPYGNFGEHCEALAIKLDESQTYRLDGEMGVVD